MGVETKATILSCIEQRSPAASVVEALLSAGTPAQECELWDYKRSISEGAESLGELCRDIVSFYNSHGGYLIFGVSDDGEIVGLSEFPFDEKQLKQKLRFYTGHDVVVRISVVEHRSLSLVCVSTPKRPPNMGVAVMRADGPAKSGRPIFKAGSVYFRADESSQLIRDSEDMKFLSSERKHFLEAPAGGDRVVQQNLPDRMMICERFIGRAEVKKELWLWLSDRMSRYRVIAGPGGVGKTSAAFSFAEDVVSAVPLGFMQVVWLSAKKQQFSAAANSYRSLPYSGTSSDSFHDFSSLLQALSAHLPIAEDQLEGAPEQDILQEIQKCLEHIPSFFVIDDLDSLAPDDQRRVVELAMVLGREKVRFLITTRKNYIAPQGSVTLLPGLDGDDFRDYIGVLERRYDRSLSSRDIKALERDTGGSPLFAESVFRLLKLGERFSEALSRWKGEEGESVRAAAFRRELEQLSLTARRALYAISQFESLSAIEIRKISELEQPQVEHALVELDQLFLVSSEQIGDIARFSAPPGIVHLLAEHRDEFVPGHAEIVRRAARHRQDSRIRGRERGQDRYVGKAIAQAMAQMAGNPSAAAATIRSALRVEAASADLWMVYARCLSGVTPLDTEAVRNAFARSYGYGKREKELFEKWIQFEIRHGNSNAAIDVAEKAREALIPPPWDWLVEAGAAFFKRASERLSRFEQSDAASDFASAVHHLQKALRFAPEAARPSVKAALDRAEAELKHVRRRA